MATTLTHPDPSSILNSRSKRLPGWSYKFNQTGNQFGLDIAIVDGLDICEKEMSAWIPYADGNSRDGVGDLLEVGGIDIARHRINPIGLFDHGKQVTLPIGLSEDPESSQYMNEIDVQSQKARAKCWFYQGKGIPGLDKKDDYDHAIFTSQLFDLLAKKYVRGGSIGYQIKSAERLAPDYDRGTPQGMHLKEVLMLEFSVVVMPANKDTVRTNNTKDLWEALDPSYRCCGRRLSPVLCKSLSAAAPPRKAHLFLDRKSGAGTAKEKSEFPGDLLFWEEEQREAEHAKKATPVPLRSVRQYDTVPPSRYRPGPGAAGHQSGEEARMHARSEGLKSLRAKYSRKAQPSDDISPEKARQILKDGEVNGHPLTEAQRGMFGAAASRDKSIDEAKAHETGHTRKARISRVTLGGRKDVKNLRQAYSKSIIGSIQKLVEGMCEDLGISATYHGFLPSGNHKIRLIPVTGNFPRAETITAWLEAAGADDVKVSQFDAQFKGLGDKKAVPEIGTKSLDIRAKYKTAKGLRRRMKNSRDGHSMVYVHSKDIDNIKTAASERGLKCSYQGTHKSGLERIRLMGDDKAIDEVAKTFGRRVK